MTGTSNWHRCAPSFVLLLLAAAGCQSRGLRVPLTSASPAEAAIESSLSESTDSPQLQLVSHRQIDGENRGAPELVLTEVERLTPPTPASEELQEHLTDLELLATQQNPALRRLRHEAAAEWAESRYVGALPDPSVSAMVFTPPMHFEPDRQLAEFQVMQMIPWLGRLRADTRRAHLEAAAAENLYRAERLRVIGELRVAWFQLYVLGKQIETTERDQAQLESLISTANARVATGNAQPGDVLLATLELSALQEQLILYRQQVAATKAEVNRLVGRTSGTPVSLPTKIDPVLPDWDHELLFQVAYESQPELNAARLRTAATRWGVEVARLQRRPDLTFGAGWMVMDAPGATMPNAGSDSFTLGVTATLPVRHRKYDAMTAEACSEHAAAHASEDEIAQRLDARLRELWEQALSSQRTIELYETSILPQARQTFEADQQALVNNTVTFERLVEDYRTLLNLELGYHRALGQLATALARIRQTAGVDLPATPAGQASE